LLDALDRDFLLRSGGRRCEVSSQSLKTYITITQVWEVIRERHLFPYVVPLPMVVRQNREWFELRLIEDGLDDALRFTIKGWQFDEEGDFFLFGGFAYCKDDAVATAVTLAAS
jgi:hypothetical protein